MIRINLLPRAPRRRIAGRPLLEIGIPLVVLVVLVVWFTVLNRQVVQIRQDIKTTEDQITQLQPEIERVEQLKKQIEDARKKEELLAQLLATQLPASSILTNVRVLIPKDVWLTSLTVPDTRSFTMEGFALSYVAVARLLDNMETAGIFEGMDLSTAERDRIGSTEVIKYGISGHLVRPGQSPEGRP